MIEVGCRRAKALCPPQANTRPLGKIRLHVKVDQCLLKIPRPHHLVVRDHPLQSTQVLVLGTTYSMPGKTVLSGTASTPVMHCELFVMQLVGAHVVLLPLQEA